MPRLRFTKAESLSIAEQYRKDRAEIGRLQNGILDYLDGKYGNRPQGKLDKCEHGRFGYESCEGCIDAHFMELLKETDHG